jgi:hypothetical protein
MERLEEEAAQRGTRVSAVEAIERQPDFSEELPADDHISSVASGEITPQAIGSPPSSEQLQSLTQLLMPDEPRLQGRTKRSGGARAAVRFLGFITRGERRIARELVNDEFDGRVRLFVHHMMDLGPVFGQPPHGRRFLDFETQIRRVRQLDQYMGGRLLHFVAWNPYRQPSDPALDSPEPLRIVHQAFELGAWGVKFYPASGYRPAENNILPRPTHPALAEQWDARYNMGGDASRRARNGLDQINKRLDQINERLFAWAAHKKVQAPIFAHSMSGEFQPAVNYGRHNARPKYWRTVLKNHNDLRLCFAHAGGTAFWFHPEPREGHPEDCQCSKQKESYCASCDQCEWGREVYHLATSFPNVYCEFGASDEILYERERETFRRRIAQLANTRGTGKYLFGDKIMYGSDWMMPTLASPRTRYLDRYREVMLTFGQNQDRSQYKKFFALNAIRYLRLAEKLEEKRNLTPTMRAELRRLLADAHE